MLKTKISSLKQKADFKSIFKEELAELDAIYSRQVVDRKEVKTNTDSANALNFFNRDFVGLEEKISQLRDLRDVIARRGDDQLEGTLEYFLELLEDLQDTVESLGIVII